MRKIITIILIGIFASCETEYNCETECYIVTDKTKRINYTVYTLVNNCTGDETIEVDYMYDGISEHYNAEIGDKICY